MLELRRLISSLNFNTILISNGESIACMYKFMLFLSYKKYKVDISFIFIIDTILTYDN
ncbi:Conserved hypothetical protein [Clostridium acetobutylicum EA 2018]|uniref:Uncharacterized protein n=1 Tax=Clostridium acetobutylicum (strain ATCC 824 / DSM 792 / JCM 1419 / IAM 19013 / LMG 5710 / NBRC 13948 / NRRL B-527 / VKM B-1787 / 2291 / W) TaxID=272562 RepID=Q97JQ8_CLOAB|nr:Hypothetical protein CA_C1215 [Clostridium acetobutylicum ATCC 824]ADZ20265.1 Conserved hypothetical protein [Clostridium acetobutylicum EA 2018]AEI31717.1 hypothetical protein SMB_G1235 [Clostridium acetobutylicum DSM 1731]